jgi:hypothetical protein
MLCCAGSPSCRTAATTMRNCESENNASCRPQSAVRRATSRSATSFSQGPPSKKKQQQASSPLAIPAQRMSSSSGGDGDYVSGTPAKRRPAPPAAQSAAAPSPQREATSGLRFARRVLPAPLVPAKARCPGCVTAVLVTAKPRASTEHLRRVPPPAAARGTDGVRPASGACRGRARCCAANDLFGAPGRCCT